MRSLCFCLTFCCAVLAQIPTQDLRNTDIPGTNTHFSMPAYASLAEWEARRLSLRKQILSAAGLLPLPERSPLKSEVFGRIERQDYAIEKVLLETWPGYYLGGNLYRPLKRSGRVPAVLNPHGHFVYGRLEHQPQASGPALAISLARQGYVVLAYDMVGYNDTLQTPHTFGGEREQLWSFSPLGLQLWNSIRAADFLESLKEVDPKRILVTGASGGATQAFLLAAVDDRIAASAPVCMISASMQGGCVCENAPGLRVGSFNVEFASLAAPRPMVVVSATGDWTKDVPREELPAIRRIYELYGKPGNLEGAHFDAGHNYNQASREAVYSFFGRLLQGWPADQAVKEGSVQVEPLADMLALENRTLPAGALTYEGLFESWKGASRRQAESITDPAARRERLRLVLGVEWPARVLSDLQGEKAVLSRLGKGDRVPGLYFDGKGEAVLVVHGEGAEAAVQAPDVRKLRAAGRPVLLIDAFQTGSAVVPRDRSAQHFLTFNLTDDANRVQDILTALAFLRQRHPGALELAGLGKAAVWCTFAAAVAPVEVGLSAGSAGFTGSDEDFLSGFFVPGIQRAGGWRTAVELARAPR